MSSGSNRRVIIDLTTLRTDTRVRGMGKYAADLARILHRANAEQGRKLDLRFLTDISWTGASSVTSDVEGALKELMAPSRSEWKGTRRARRLAFGYERMIRREKPRLVHLPEPNVIVPNVKGVTRLVTCHDLIPLLFQDQYLPKKKAREREWSRSRVRYTNADHVLSISEATALDLQRLHNVPSKKVTVVHHGVEFETNHKPDDEACDKLLEAGQISGPFFLFVGDADPRKNADGICAALGKLPVNTPLVWVGRLSSVRRALINSYAKKTAARILFTDFVSDAVLKAFYKKAIALLFVSRYEGFGYPVVEAMRMGCPVITSTTSSLPEVAGDAALLVEPESIDEISSAMQKVLDDDSLRTQMKNSGYKQSAKFTFERQASQTLALYQRLLEREV